MTKCVKVQVVRILLQGTVDKLQYSSLIHGSDMPSLQVLMQ